MTLYEKIKAMSLEEMAEFFDRYDYTHDVVDYNCTKCQDEHGGICFLEKCGIEGCIFDSKETLKRWLTQELDPQPKDYYTPEEVRNMSREEVKANYTAILDSMKKWN